MIFCDAPTIDDAPEIENDVSVVETVPGIEDDQTFTPSHSASAEPSAKDQTSSRQDVNLSQ